MKLGCIGDDFTGSTDLGLMLAAGGMRVVQYVGVPDGPADPGVEAGIVALKSRSIPVADAVAQSLDACRWLRAQGAERIVFKYCSTFDSTPEGNIGPVIDALMAELETDAPVIVCPVFPEAGRTLFMGHLFVGDRLLSESGMENHPLTPMTDPDIRRWLAHQTRHEVGHLRREDYADMDRATARERESGRQVLVCDAIDADDLHALAALAARCDLITGGSGIALGLPAALGVAASGAGEWRGEDGPALILSGSCSVATRGQVERHAANGGAARKLESDAIVAADFDAGEAIDWALSHELPLLYTSADPEEVRAAQERHGRERVAGAIEDAFAALARTAVERGVGRLIVAGGETSGAVVSALDARALEIGPRIAAGVPAVRVTGRPLVLALKSGNFGGPDFFAEAAGVLRG